MKISLDETVDATFGIKPERPPEKTEKEIEELAELYKYIGMMYGFSYENREEHLNGKDKKHTSRELRLPSNNRLLTKDFFAVRFNREYPNFR